MDNIILTQKSTVPLNILEIIDGFIEEHLKTRQEAIQQIANLKCGFEKWMQLEFILWAINKYKLDPSKTGENDEIGIGIEHYTKINEPKGKWKIVDIWLHAADKGTHYIEIKSTVKGWNERKQISSWIDDYEYLRNIHNDYYPWGISSILFGSSTKDDKWEGQEWENDLNLSVEKIRPMPKIKYRIIGDGNLRVAILYKEKDEY